VRAYILLILIILANFVSLKAIAIEKNSIVINIPSRTLDLYVDGKVKKTYPVGVGRAQFPTPTGQFKVIRKVVNPGWENPYKPVGYSRIQAGSTNPLGTRWIGFKADSKGEFGIHGTDSPQSVGKFSSHGCVRMLVEDAEELFEYININTPVHVTYNTARINIQDSKVYISLYPDAYNRGETTIQQLRNIIQNLNTQVLWNASIALSAINSNAREPVKIGTIIDETDFY
jgi:murein L,D-transpeptidase YcbB/YkuD